MKKLFIQLLLPFIFSFDKGKEPPSKFYYKDNDNITIWSFSDNDTAIYIRSEIHDIFNIKAETKKYQIYYDKKLTILAVDIDVNKKEKIETYKRYSRQGQLLASYKRINRNYVGIYDSYYYSGKIKSKTYHDNSGNRIGDTTWYENGNIKNLDVVYDKTTSKSQNYFSNGKLKREIFDGSYQADTRFIIDYDSIYSKPKYYLCRDTIVVSITDRGEEIATRQYRMTPLDSVIVIKKK
jgi:antitoxin component YwqK of YwqJK toxin-antitoxin module